ncbi:MAG: amino acid adenylation domain-containing protein, partial [Bacteroidota bacterium]
MDIIDLIKDLEDQQIALTLDGADLQVSFDGDQISETLVTKIRTHKSDLVKYLKKYTHQAAYRAIPTVPLADSYPVSDAQHRLWILSQFPEGSIAYNLPNSIHLSGDFDIDLFKQAIDAVVERHEILRTVFRSTAQGAVHQWILPAKDCPIPIGYQDFRTRTDTELAVEEYLLQDLQQPFDLENGPLLRAALLHVKGGDYVFYYNMHHIISDGWSIGILARDVLHFYESQKAGNPPQWPSLKIQYKDYAAWQVKQLAEAGQANHRQYWLNRLSGELPILDLPRQQARPKMKGFHGETLETFLSLERVEAMHRFTRENGGSLFILLLSLWNVLFHRYTGLKDLIIGSPVAGRNHSDLEDQIGFYINTLALRNSVDPENTFLHFYEKVKQSTIEAFDHQMYPFDRLVDDLSLKRDTSRNALFDVLLILQNSSEKVDDFELDAKQVEQIHLKIAKTSKFDIEISFMELGVLYSLTINYNTDLYDRSCIEDLMHHFKQLLDVCLTQPNTKIGEASYLSEEEKHLLTETFNATQKDYPEWTVMELLEQQVQKRPEEIAIYFEEESLTYAELNSRSNQLAHYLRQAHQVTTADCVGVMLKRSLESVIAMIGVMKSGACYTPVDPTYPPGRIEYLLKDADIQLLLTQNDLAAASILSKPTLLDLTQLDLSDYADTNPDIQNQLDDGAFVIYTSGSTGNPKGVVQTHRMMSNLIQWDLYHSGIATGLKHLQYASFSFDASLHDIYFALSGGGSVYVVSDRIRMDYTQLRAVIIEEKIQVLSFPFSALSLFFAQNDLADFVGHQIQYIVSTAEQLYVGGPLAQFLRQNPALELHNHYGPSETHVVTSYAMSMAENNVVGRPSIGYPISNSSLYILDDYLNLVPLGARGEVYIGGANLAKGYLNLSAQTDERFVDHPFRKGEKVYKTGDLAYWQADGTIIYLGRKDDQVKIRGYRIELGEIEQTLLRHSAIEEAVVLVKQNELQESELVAFITSKADQEQQSILL